MLNLVTYVHIQVLIFWITEKLRKKAFLLADDLQLNYPTSIESVVFYIAELRIPSYFSEIITASALQNSKQ